MSKLSWKETGRWPPTAWHCSSNWGTRGERLDALVRVERPLGTGNDPIVVEDAERTNAHPFGIAITVEAELPPGVGPATLPAPDRVRLEDDDRPGRGAQIDRSRLRS